MPCTLLEKQTTLPRPLVKLGEGPRGPGPPERPDGPCKTSFWEGSRRPGKAPPLKSWWTDDFCIDVLLQFASVTVYWNYSARRFCSPKYDFWRDLRGASKNSTGSLLLAIHDPLDHCPRPPSWMRGVYPSIPTPLDAFGISILGAEGSLVPHFLDQSYATDYGNTSCCFAQFAVSHSRLTTALINIHVFTVFTNRPPTCRPMFSLAGCFPPMNSLDSSQQASCYNDI